MFCGKFILQQIWSLWIFIYVNLILQLAKINFYFFIEKKFIIYYTEFERSASV